MKIEDLAIRRPAPPHRGIYWLIAAAALVGAWFARANLYQMLDWMGDLPRGLVDDRMRVDALELDGTFTLCVLFALRCGGHASSLGLGLPTGPGGALRAVLDTTRYTAAAFILIFLATPVERGMFPNAVLVGTAVGVVLLVGPRAVELLGLLRIAGRVRMPSGDHAGGSIERIAAESLTLRVGKQELLVATDAHTLFGLGPAGLELGSQVEVYGARDGQGGGVYREAALPSLHATHVIADGSSFARRMRSIPRRAALEIALIAATVGHCVVAAALVLTK